MKTTHDCIILGGGPGGLTTALYLQRFQRKTLVIDNGESRVKRAPRIRNLAGYTSGISGNALLSRLRKQALQYNATFLKAEAVVFRRRGGFEVRAGGKSYFSKFVVLATGFKDQQLSGFDERGLTEKGVIAYCPVCDGYEHCGQDVGVLVNSSNGFHKIKFLYNFTKRLHMIVVKDIEIPARHMEKVRKYRVKVHKGSLEKLGYNGKSKKLVVKLKSKSAFEIDLAYVALGTKVPTKATEHLKKLRRSSDGFLEVTQHQETSVRGIYGVGDCVKGLAQVSVAIGQAAVAATHIHNQLSQ